MAPLSNNSLRPKLLLWPLNTWGILLGQQIPLLTVLIGAALFTAQHSRFGVGGADREEAGFSLSSGPCFFP